MKLYYRHLIGGLIIVAALISTESCENQQLPFGEAGILEGIVSIGPLCPVETDPPQPECLPTAETYLAYPVSVWSSNGKTKIKEINPALDGSYSIDLPEGRYMIILETGDFGPGSSNLPAKVIIQRGDTAFFNVDIDTGIR
ncbi:MAG: hypothetical protein E4G95_05895 [Bacteroidia bacterium]|nr:MAG: hypothetical protein E4G95_05895 [Bacteroidia bacterium]